MDYLQRSRENMLVGQLLTNKVVDPVILSAMSSIPRELCVAEKLRGVAYVDEDIEVAPGRFLLEPLILARLLQLAHITPDAQVLDVACATGYSSAIISRLAARVTALEEVPDLAERARKLMYSLNATNVHVVTGNHALGVEQSAPYDVILIAGSVQEFPMELATQLAEGGRMVFVDNIAQRPGVATGLGRAVVVSKHNGQFATRIEFDASVPVVPGFERKKRFVF